MSDIVETEKTIAYRIETIFFILDETLGFASLSPDARSNLEEIADEVRFLSARLKELEA